MSQFDPTQPESTQPEATQPDSTQPGSMVQLEGGQPAASLSEPTQPVPMVTSSWYRRRPAQIAAAGVAAAGIALGGALVYAGGASGEPTDAPPTSPQAAVQRAFEDLTDGSVGVTISEAGSTDSLTFTKTPAGIAFGFSGKDGSFHAAVLGERLYLKVDASGTEELRDNPMASLLLSGRPSVGALLDGKWVSIDVSEDSPVLAALSAAQSEQQSAVDSERMREAGEDLAKALREIGDDLAEPLQQAVADHMTVTQVDDQAAAPGSAHYRVEVASAEVRTDVADELKDAAADLESAWDAFVEDAGAALTSEVPGAADIHKDLTSALDKGMAESVEPVVVEVYVANGELSRVQIDDTTLAFVADPTLAEVSGAVSMDEDLVALFPLIASLGSSSEGDAGSLQLGLGLTPDA